MTQHQTPEQIAAFLKILEDCAREAAENENPNLEAAFDQIAALIRRPSIRPDEMVEKLLNALRTCRAELADALDYRGKNESALQRAWNEANAAIECAALAAMPGVDEEVRIALKFYADAWKCKPNKRYGGLEWSPKEELLDDCGNKAKHALSRLKPSGAIGAEGWRPHQTPPSVPTDEMVERAAHRFMEVYFRNAPDDTPIDVEEVERAILSALTAALAAQEGK